ncbi:MAG: hypothetical protein KBF17_03790 [Candidatus Promineofilum sp.]|nr:hypothetical protein [Promineifilum sp.]MBP9656768.1 hypothetical protein [Promineifilum sp.]
MNQPPHPRRHISIIAALLVLLISSMVWAGSSAASEQPASLAADSSFVVRIYYDDIADIDRLSAFDVWEYNNHEERYVLAAVDYAGYSALIDSGWRVAIDEAAGAQLNSRQKRFTNFFGGYRTVDQLYADLEAMNQASPDLSELVQYGHSHCLSQGGCIMKGGETLPGFPLLAMRVTNENRPGSSIINGENIAMGSKPVFFLMANIHAREITTPEIAMRFLEQLLDGYGNDPDVTWLVDHHEIWIVPTVNPDGHWLVELGETPAYDGPPFYQRKNANNDADNDGTPDCSAWPPGEAAQPGIDLNRNHSFEWDQGGTSDYPCDLTYLGPSAASENESAAIEDLISALIPDQRGPDLNDAAPDDTTGIFITLHSYSNLVLWPWGSRSSAAPNKMGLQAIGDKFATFNGYQSCQSGPCLYRTSGATDDWAYGILGIPAYTFEIGNKFMPPFSEIENRQWPDNGPALLYAAKIARTPYMIVRGPVVNQPAVSGDNPLLTLTATVDDTNNGGQRVVAAVATIDTPPWIAGVGKVALQAADGEFDSSVEAITGSIPTAGLMPGWHIIFVEGQDMGGNRGAVSAAFFEVSPIGLLSERGFIPLATVP